MANQRIIYTTLDGGVAVVIPTGEISIEEVAAKNVPKGVAYSIVTADAILADRTFRNAWVINGGAVAEDLEKCKAIGHERRRQLRADEFEPHDKAIALRLPDVDSIAEEAARQAIRDKYDAMEVAIDAATTPAGVKAALAASY